MPPEPLIVTLALDDVAQERFDRLRREHFPPERNHLAAHVTLFHALPGDRLADVDHDLGRAVRRPGFDVDVSGVRLLGRGVAYELTSAELDRLRAALAERWAGWLTPQDRQRHRPHVTVQNKVAPGRARALHAELCARFEPWRTRAAGLDLWRYAGGPWQHLRRYAFTG